jgi:hypothetical protein
MTVAVVPLAVRKGAPSDKEMVLTIHDGLSLTDFVHWQFVPTPFGLGSFRSLK